MLFCVVDLVNLPSDLPRWFVLQNMMNEEDAKEQQKQRDPAEMESLPAYVRAQLNARSPLVSASVKFDKKLSIVNDDDND